MDEHAIHEKLRSGQLDGFVNAVKGRLVALSSHPEQCVAFIKNLFKDVIKSQESKAAGDLPQEVLTTVEASLEMLADLFKVRKCTDLSNVLYHVFALLLKQELFTQAGTAACLIFPSMEAQSPGDPKASVLITNMYVQLWNAAFRLWQDNYATHQETSFSLLLQAIQFLCLKNDLKTLLERVTCLGCWCVSKFKSADKLSSLYHVVLPRVNEMLTHSPDQFRANVPIVHELLLEKGKHTSRLGGEVNLHSEWKDLMQQCLPGKEKQLKSHVLGLLKLVDQTYGFHSSIISGKPVTPVKIPSSLNWKGCIPETEELSCLVATVAAIDVKLYDIYTLVEASSRRQEHVAAMAAVVELAPFFKTHLTHLHSIGADTCHVIVAMRGLRYLLTLYLYLAQEAKEDHQLAKLLHKCEDYYPSSLLKIAQYCISESKDIANLGSVFYLLAYCSFQNKVNEFIIRFSKMSLDLIALHMNHHEDGNRMEIEVAYWRKCELLIWQYRQEKLHSEALEAIAKALSIVPALRTQVMSRWVKTKKEVTYPALAKRNLLAQLKLLDVAEPSDDDKFDLLSTELNVSIREGLPAHSCLQVFLDLKELATLCGCELKRCYVLAQTARLLGRFPELEIFLCDTFEESSQKAVSSLRSLLESGKGDTSVVKLLLAASLFGQYINKIETLRSLAGKEVTEAAVDPSEIKCHDPILSQALAEEKDYSCDIALGYRHINVGYELASQDTLDEALMLWSLVLQGGSSNWGKLLRDIVECWFLEQIKVVSEVYLSSFRVLQEMKAITLWYNVAKDLRLGQEIVLAASSLMNCLVKVGMVEAASQVAEQNLGAADALEEGIPKLRFLLARSNMLYAKEQFSDGFQLLSQVLRHPLMRKNTKSCLLFMAQVRLLECHYSQLPSTISDAFRSTSDSVLRNETPINLAQEALKLAQGVMRHLVDGSVTEPSDPEMMWTLERALLDSAALLGQLYISIGAAREAYSFLKVYLHRAQVVVSATRCARLILLIASMDLMCEKLLDVKHKLAGVEFMLHLRNFSFPKNSSNVALKRTKLGDESSESEEVPSMAPLHIEPSHSLAVRRYLERSSKPQSPPSIPELDKQHDSNCPCQLCQFISTKQLWLERDVLKCQLYLTVGDIPAAIRGFESLLSFQCALQQHLERETDAVVSFLRAHLSESLSYKISSTVGGWGELLSLHATILLHLSEAYQLRMSYSMSLERVNKGLDLFLCCGGLGDKVFWKVFASLMHQKVKVLLIMASKANGSSGDLKQNVLWLSNSNDHAKRSETCHGTILSPIRQSEDAPAVRVPNAPKPRKNTPMDMYVKSLMCDELATMRYSKGKKASFQVYDENNEKVLENSVTRRRSTRRAVASSSRFDASSGDDRVEAPRMPKKPVRPQRKPAKPDLASTEHQEQDGRDEDVEDSLSIVDGILQQTFSKWQSGSLNVIDEEEAIGAVARSSVGDLPTEKAQALAFMQQDDFAEEQLGGCKHVASLEEMARLLEDALKLVIHFPPCPLYAEMRRTMVHVLSLQKKCTAEQRSAFFWHLSETAAVTFQHVGLNCLNKKLKKQAAASVEQGQPTGQSRPEMNKAQALSFKFLPTMESGQLTKLCELLPSDWTVVQLVVAGSIAKTPRGTMLAPDLLVSQYRKGRSPIAVHLSGSSDSQFHLSLFKEFKSILDESTATTKMTAPAIWWTVRRALDKRLKELLESIENVWVGCWKGIFHGKLASATDYHALKSSVTQVLANAAKHKLCCCSTRLLEAVIDSVGDLTSYQLSVAVCQLFGITGSHPAHSALVRTIKSHAMADAERHPVIIILDKAIQALPWESIPILRKNSVSRSPSMSFLQAQLLYYKEKTENVYSQGVDTRKTYFILNPSNDIPKTQAQFENIFKGQGWAGVAGKPPQKVEFQSAIAGKDLIIYSGHGSGREYLCGDVIEQMLCHACPVLMGCASGRLKVFGPKIEPCGIVLQYLLGGSPCVVANLWDVTDRDIDRFTEEFLRSWIPQLVSTAHIPNVSTAVQASRKACKLQYLIGAAPVVYGIPVHTISIS